MICPNENSEMRQVKVESHYGQAVILDQCPECGGIWFDKSELYMAKPGEADKIELLDVDILQNPSAIEKSELICPRDRGKLVRFTDPYFPKDIIIVRCPICEGLWLNRGEFVKYQNFRQSKWKPREITPEEEKLEQDLKAMLAAHNNGDNTELLGKLGNFLSTPIDSQTWQPLEPNKFSQKEGVTFNLIINILNMILSRFMLR